MKTDNFMYLIFNTIKSGLTVTAKNPSFSLLYVGHSNNRLNFFGNFLTTPGPGSDVLVFYNCYML